MLCKIPAIWEQTGFNLRRQPLTIHSNLHDIVKELSVSLMRGNIAFLDIEKYSQNNSIAFKTTCE